MAEIKNPQCCKRVFDGFYTGPCMRQGKVEREGKWYCKQHDPEAVAARNKAQREEWDRDRAVQQVHWDRESAMRKLCEGFTTEQLKHARIVVDADYVESGSDNPQSSPASGAGEPSTSPKTGSHMTGEKKAGA